MTIRKFIKECAKEDSQIGDLANDILRDKDFPFKMGENEIWEYLDSKTLSVGTNDSFLEFKEKIPKDKIKDCNDGCLYFKFSNARIQKGHEFYRWGKSCILLSISN